MQSDVSQPQTKCYTLIWSNHKPDAALLCGSTYDQMIQSNAVAPIFFALNNKRLIKNSLFDINGRFNIFHIQYAFTSQRASLAETT